ncbi:hypothetical protein CA51_09570 [Rosistilla oblonga]|nr:hypothetical protein CA51_09570 [Rosistilla oblonga]
MKRYDFTRPAKQGGSENEPLATFSGEGLTTHRTGANAARRPSPNFASLVRPSPSKLSLRNGEATQLHSPSEAGRVGKRAFSDVFRGGPNNTSGRSDRCATPLPELRFARSPLPFQTAFAGRVKCYNFIRPAKLGGSENERLATFSEEGLTTHRTGANAARRPSPNFASLVRPSPSKLRLGEGEVLQLHSPSEAGRVGKRAFSDVFRGGSNNTSDRSERRATPLPELRFARPTLPFQTAFGGG